MSIDPIIKDHQLWIGFVQPEGLVVSPAALKNAQAVLGTRGRQEAEAMRRIIEDQRKRILARKEDVKRNEAQLTLGFDKMELQQMEEERKDWDKRLTAIGREVDEEPARILKSYEVQAHRVEPIGVVYLWPISG